jgi:hypothetical protein
MFWCMSKRHKTVLESADLLIAILRALLDRRWTMKLLSGGSTAQGISSWHNACEKPLVYGTLSLQFAEVKVGMISG